MGQDSSQNQKEEPKIQPKKKERKPVKYATTVFSWPYGGKSVCIIGSFNKWKKEIPMHYNHEDRTFSVMMTLRTGKHYIRYIVDDEFQIDKRLPTHNDRDGYSSNIIYIREEEQNPSHLQAHDSSPLTPGTGPRKMPARPLGITRSENNERVKRLPNKPPPNHQYPPKSLTFGRIRTHFYESRKTPPLLPPHLSYTNLNLRTYDPIEDADNCFGKGILPLPVHVTSNHLYFKRSKNPNLQNLYMYGITTYYGPTEDRKFTTTKLYTSIKESTAKKEKREFVTDIIEIGMKGSLGGRLIRRRKIGEDPNTLRSLGRSGRNAFRIRGRKRKRKRKRKIQNNNNNNNNNSIDESNNRITNNPPLPEQEPSKDVNSINYSNEEGTKPVDASVKKVIGTKKKKASKSALSLRNQLRGMLREEQNSLLKRE